MFALNSLLDWRFVSRVPHQSPDALFEFTKGFKSFLSDQACGFKIHLSQFLILDCCSLIRRNKLSFSASSISIACVYNERSSVCGTCEEILRNLQYYADAEWAQFLNYLGKRKKKKKIHIHINCNGKRSRWAIFEDW